MPPASAEVLVRDRRKPRRWPLVLVAGIAVLSAARGVAALRPEPVPKPPRPVTAWAAAGSRAQDARLKEIAWRGWAAVDRSVRLDTTAMLVAEDWPDARRTVVLLAAPAAHGTQVAVMLVSGDRAERVATHRLYDGNPKWVAELVEAGGHSGVVAVAPGATRMVVTAAVTGASRAAEVERTVAGGAFVPVPDGQTATRVVLTDRTGRVLADRVPGSDLKHTPPLPLVVSERVEGSRRVQTRTDGAGLTCEVGLRGGSWSFVDVDCPDPQP